MTSVNDPQNTEGRLRAELEELRETEIPQDDKDAILSFFESRRSNNNLEKSSQLHLIKHLRLTAERTEVPLVEMGKKDLERFTIRLLNEWGLQQSTVNGYKAHWKPFFEWKGEEWATDIEFYDRGQSDKIKRWKIFSEDEKQAILDEAVGVDHAAIAFMLDVAARIGLVCSATVGRVEYENGTMYVRVNEEAPVKGADGRLPLTWSRGPIQSYLQNGHPRPDRDDVALFHKTSQWDENSKGAYSTGRLRQRIQNVMKEAGIEDSRRRRPHNFRHTRITEWLRQGLSDTELLYMTKWNDLSQRERYGHLLDEEKAEMYLDSMGYTDDQDNQSSQPASQQFSCTVCGGTVNAQAQFCPGCGNPVDAQTAVEEAGVGKQDPETTAEELSQIDGVVDEMGPAAVIEQILENNPEIIESIDVDIESSDLD